jgi:hypothetical protein
MYGFKFFLEYAESDSVDAHGFMEMVYAPNEYELDYEMGTLIIYTDMNPELLEDDIYSYTGAYAINYGRV